jgi:hypothetical protein
MYLEAMASSIAVAAVFAVVLIIMVPATRNRPHAREGLWIAWYMLTLAVFSIIALVVVGMLGAPEVVYLAAMVAMVLFMMWRRSRRFVVEQVGRQTTVS